MFVASPKANPTDFSAKRQAPSAKRQAPSAKRQAPSAKRTLFLTDYFYPLISRLLGLLLLAASLLKAYQRAGLFLLAPRSPERWLYAGTIALEMLLGLWLLIGFQAELTRWIAQTCFAIFLGVSLAKGVAGEASCGCFGAVSVNPWITAGIDGLAVLVLHLARPADRSNRILSMRPKHRLAFGLLGLVILGSGAWWVVGAQATRLNNKDEVPGSMIVLDPQDWIGRRLPLLSQIDSGEQLSFGDWLIVLYRSDCQSCHEQLPLLFTALRRIHLGSERRTLVALVEVPSNSLRPSFLGNERPDAWVKLPAGPQWIVQTPLFLRVQDGNVREAAFTVDAALRLVK